MDVAVEGSTWVNARGYGRFTRELTRALARNAHRHTFTLVLDSGAAAAPDLPEMPRVVVPTRRAVVDAAAAEGARSIRDIWAMTKALSDRRFDAVLFPTVYSFVPVTSRAHVTVVIHDALPEKLPALVLGSRRARLLWRLKTTLACRRANLIATVSQAAADDIRRHLPVRGPMAVLTEGASDVFSAVPARDDGELVRAVVGHRSRYLLYVGGLSPHKRIPALVRAFGEVAADSDLALVMAGPWDQDRFHADARAVDEAIASIGAAAGRIVRPGFVHDRTLAALYRGAQCVVLPSAGEGFGLPALEAMSCGAPMVMARAPALAELCGPAAEYVDDPAELSCAISRVLTNPELRSSRRALGLERATRFGWDEAARRLLSALDEHGARARET